MKVYARHYEDLDSSRAFFGNVPLARLADVWRFLHDTDIYNDVRSEEFRDHIKQIVVKDGKAVFEVVYGDWG